MKILVIVVVSLAALLGVGLMVGAHFRAAASQAALTIVKVEPVARGDLVETVAAPGEIQPLKKVSISAKVAAPIVAMPFKEGQHVYGPGPTTQPSLLVQLDDKDLQAVKRQLVAQEKAQEEQIHVATQRIEAQKAAIRAARATLADLERDLKRNKALLETHDVSQSVLDTAQAKYEEQFAQIDSSEQNLEADRINLKVMEAQLDAAKAQVAKAEEDIKYTTITSPIDGTLTSVQAEVGEMVVTGTMNNAGTVIMEVADLSQMLMVAHVDESQIDPLRVGQRATVRMQAYRDQVFEGTVYTVGESRTQDRNDRTDMTKYFEVKILLDLKGRRIRSGLSADAEIETQRHATVLRVPSQAVVGRALEQLSEEARKSPDVDKGKAQATVVFRCIDGKSVVTPVKVGASDETHTIIKSGLNEGDPVIVGPYKVLESLQNGQAVKTEAVAAPATRPSTTVAGARS